MTILSKLKQLAKTNTTKIIFCLLLVFIMWGNNSVSLWDQDEASYAGFALNMVNNANWLLPEFMWSEIHVKPPLHFYAIAISYKLFGINEFALRFFSSLAFWFSLILIYWQTKKMFNPKIAINAVLVMASSLIPLSLAKIATTDSLLFLFKLIVAISLLNLLKEKRKIWVFLFWLSLAIGFMIKGPAIAVFTCIFAFLLFVFDSNRKNLFYLHPWFFLPLALAPIFIWGYLLWHNGYADDLQWMLDWYLFNRTNTKIYAQILPIGTYLAFFALSFICYLAVLPNAFISLFKNLKQGFLNLKQKIRQTNETNVAIWFVSAWLFYEFIGVKLPSYTIVAYPALAIFLAIILAEKIKASKVMLIIQTFFTVLLTLLIAYIPFYLETGPKLMIAIASLIMLISQIYNLIVNLKKSEPKLIIANALIFAFLIWLVVIPNIDDFRNDTKKLAIYLKDKPIEQIIIANKENSPPSLPFYLKVIAKKELVEDYDHFSLLQKYQGVNKLAFVLKKKQLQFLKDEIKDLKYYDLSSPLAKKTKVQNYYVVFN